MCIKDPGSNKKLLFANIAIGTVIKPARVSPSFNCAVIISNSEKFKTEKAFLNRFEKYDLSHEVLFYEAVSECKFDRIKNILLNAHKRVR